MIRELHVPLFDISLSLSNALDLISSSVTNHHKHVAYIASAIAAEIGLSKDDEIDILLAGTLHDIGALSLKERLDTLNFEIDLPHRHAEKGYYLLKDFAPFAKIAPLIRYHHLPWSNGSGESFNGEEVPLGSHILHLADRVDVLIDRDSDILNQVDDICEKVERFSGKLFHPELIDGFKRVAQREYFWLDLVSFSLERVLARKTRTASVELDIVGLIELTRIYSKIIDFRSRFTATHSSGVAAVSETLAALVGMSRHQCLKMKVAGYLHDLGKLAIPTTILEKAEKLTSKEYNIIKRHTFYTYRILENVKGLEQINSWAALHHERLDGRGYPFGHKGDELSLGSRIVAVADVFTALTEDRPYRQGMEKDKVMDILEDMVQTKALDSRIVKLLKNNYEKVNKLRYVAQTNAAQAYTDFEEKTDLESKNRDSYQEIIKDTGEKKLQKETTVGMDKDSPICSVCGYHYQGEVPFTELDLEWRCPICGASKEAFK